MLLRRDQRSAMLGGKPVFTLDVRADLTAEEKANIAKYRLGDAILFQRFSDDEKRGDNFGAAVLRFLRDLTITVSELENGRRFECKDIREMVASQAAIKEAAIMFKTVLDTAAQFGGEEVIEV